MFFSLPLRGVVRDTKIAILLEFFRELLHDAVGQGVGDHVNMFFHLIPCLRFRCKVLHVDLVDLGYMIGAVGHQQAHECLFGPVRVRRIQERRKFIKKLKQLSNENSAHILDSSTAR